MKKLLYLFFAFIFFSCSSTKQVTSSSTNNSIKTELADDETFVLTEISTDATYGYSEKNAINVGGNKNQEGPKNERRFLNALAGPNGERVTYYRLGSCCGVKSENGFMGIAMLDKYSVTWEGAEKSVVIYINMYDAGVLKAPVGFTIKK